jgi:hypothetical protein
MDMNDKVCDLAALSQQQKKKRKEKKPHTHLPVHIEYVARWAPQPVWMQQIKSLFPVHSADILILIKI